MKSNLLTIIILILLSPFSYAFPEWSDWGDWLDSFSLHFEDDYWHEHRNRRPDVMLFEHAYRRGEAIGLYVGETIVDLSEIPMEYDDWNDTVSSIRLRPGIEVWLYEHAGFRGRRLRLTHSQNDMSYINGREGWNDRVSSIRVVREHERDREDRPRRERDHPERDRKENDSKKSPPRHGFHGKKPVATLYEHSAYGGDQLQLFAGQSIPDLAPVPGEWNDSISSIHLKPGIVLELYEDAGFRGRKIVIDRSQGNLVYPRSKTGYGRFESWNDRISSIRVVAR